MCPCLCQLDLDADISILVYGSWFESSSGIRDPYLESKFRVWDRVEHLGHSQSLEIPGPVPVDFLFWFQFWDTRYGVGTNFGFGTEFQSVLVRVLVSWVLWSGPNQTPTTAFVQALGPIPIPILGPSPIRFTVPRVMSRVLGSRLDAGA
uniref:Uncharacterized protein n=1 Tax=Cannabis sativa TaxID=3483 RepID=A0A803QDG5_CANSA